MVSPVNSELAKFYIELSYLHKKAFIEDNFDDFLDKRVNEFGVYRKLGTEATGEVIFEGRLEQLFKMELLYLTMSYYS